ncbi:MAG: histidine kinase [Ignavibacteriaceae bacterium]
MKNTAFIQAKEFIDLLFDFNNPIYYSILATIFVLIIVYFFYYYIIYPLNKKHFLEKNELELKQVRLMALFADLDPDPVLRIDETGKVIYTNNEAKVLPEFSRYEGENINKLLPNLDISISELVRSNLFHSYSTYINKKYYLISLRGNSFLNIGQIYFHDITDIKRYENRLRSSRKRLKFLSHHLINLIEEERQRIARELHDSIGQNLLFLKLKMQNMQNLNSNGNSDEYKALTELFETTIKDLKNVIYDLKPKILEEMGLAPALLYLCDRISNESKIEGKVDVTGFEKRISLKKEVALFRVAQEALNNIIKYSEAKNFNIQLVRTPDKVRVIISDDGIGFEPDNYKSPENGGYGLLNMRERVSNLNGVFKIDSSKNNGTVIITEIPIGADDGK